MHGSMGNSDASTTAPGWRGWLRPTFIGAAAAAACRCLPPPPPAARRFLAHSPGFCLCCLCREGLLVFGVAAEIHCDPQAAAEVEEGRALVPCWGDAADLADRHDAR